MATVFKRKGDSRYTIGYYDHTGRRRFKSSKTTDKRAAERIAGKLEADTALRREGVIDPQTEIYSATERRQLAAHVEDFYSALKATGATVRYADLVNVRVTRIVELCKAERISQLTPSKVLAAIEAIRSGGVSLQTCLHYVRGISNSPAGWHATGGLRLTRSPS